MEILEIIRHRRSIRKYTTEPVPASMLDCIIDAGRFAPSGGNSQTTHFLVIQNSHALQLLRETAAEEFGKMEIREGMYRSLVSSIRLSQRKGTGYDFTYGAPVLILLANKRGYGNAMADCSCALENMMIAAHAIGLGACWINQLHWLDEEPAVRAYLEELGLSPEETVCGGLSLGLPDQVLEPLERTGNRIDWVD